MSHLLPSALCPTSAGGLPSLRRALPPPCLQLEARPVHETRPMTSAEVAGMKAREHVIQVRQRLSHTTLLPWRRVCGVHVKGVWFM